MQKENGAAEGCYGLPLPNPVSRPALFMRPAVFSGNFGKKRPGNAPSGAEFETG